MTTEADLYSSLLRPQLIKYGHCQRIENAVAQGTPDLVFTAKDQVNWIETKLTHKVEGQLVLLFEKFQLPVISQLSNAAPTKVWVIAADHDLMQVYLLIGRLVIEAPRFKHRKWTAVPLAGILHQYHMGKPRDWPRLIGIILGQVVA